jgi:formate dehydrogenase major subunit
MLKKIDSVCTYCGVGCEITAETDNKNIFKIKTNKNGKASNGELCIKGVSGYEFLNSYNRVNNCLIKEEFLEKNSIFLDEEQILDTVTDKKEQKYFVVDYELGYKIASQKITEIINKYSSHSFCSIGGARTSCENSYIFQKFTREIIGSPHVDNCARVCHSPSLQGMKTTIGEGASTNPFDDIFHTENIIIIGSNTTEAHPIVANRVKKAVQKGVSLSVLDVRKIEISEYANFSPEMPFEANLLVLNMLAFVILKENLYNLEFINSRTEGFEEYKNSILNDEFANPEFFRKVKNYEYLADEIPKIARLYATKKSLILWGLGISEHLDGSTSVMAITHLALLTGNVGKHGAGLMPLRGQNNVQGTCDVGMLPYYAPDYQTPKEIGKMTPDLIDGMLTGEIKALFNVGEDLAHIHGNQNKIQKALKKLDLLIVNEVMFNEITTFADIIFGVKSAYEKSGVYVNAERRLHLSQPLIDSNLPDDWEVIQNISQKLNSKNNSKLSFNSSEELWNEVRQNVSRYREADYNSLNQNRSSGLQWPVFKDENNQIKDTVVLHETEFRTENGLGKFAYHQYKLRGQIQELLETQNSSFYLTTGRILEHYNNSAQTIPSEKLTKKYDQDILLVSEENREEFEKLNKNSVVLFTEYGETAELKFEFSNKIKKNTLYTTFHFPKSKINFIFGDEGDEFVKTTRFKSIKVGIK